jgi:hypothetical protein
MVRSKRRTHRTAPPAPPPPIIGAEPLAARTPRRPLEPTESWYLDCLERVIRALGRGVSSVEFGAQIDRTSTPTYRMLTKLEALGYVARDSRGRWHARPEDAA